MEGEQTSTCIPVCRRGSRLQPLVVHAATGGAAHADWQLHYAVHGTSAPHAVEDVL